MSTARKSWTPGELFHNTAGRYSQKKKDQKENEEPSPVVDKPAPYDEAVEGCHSPTGLPTTGCCSLYKLAPQTVSSFGELTKLKRLYPDTGMTQTHDHDPDNLS